MVLGLIILGDLIMLKLRLVTSRVIEFLKNQATRVSDYLCFTQFRPTEKTWRRIASYCWLRLRGIKVVGMVGELPFKAKEGTKCYVNKLGVIVQRVMKGGQRWEAVGNSPEAQRLNAQINGWTREAENFDVDKFLADCKKDMADFTESILQEEFARANFDERFLVVKSKDPGFDN